MGLYLRLGKQETYTEFMWENCMAAWRYVNSYLG